MLTVGLRTFLGLRWALAPLKYIIYVGRGGGKGGTFRDLLGREKVEMGGKWITVVTTTRSLISSSL